MYAATKKLKRAGMLGLSNWKLNEIQARTVNDLVRKINLGSITYTVIRNLAKAGMLGFSFITVGWQILFIALIPVFVLLYIISIIIQNVF